MNIGGHQQLSPQQMRRRRIGKKVLACNRIARVLERTSGASTKKKQKSARFKPTKLQVLITSASIVLVAIVAGGGYTLFHTHQVEQQKQAAAAKALRVEAAEAKAAECRSKKAAAKADQIGTITYDQLYDYKSCDITE